jgi:hypothetical protein
VNTPRLHDALWARVERFALSVVPDAIFDWTHTDAEQIHSAANPKRRRLL